MNDHPPEYIPVVYELLVFVFSYTAALCFNIAIVMPVSFILVRWLKKGLVAGLVSGLLIALVADIVAYAFEIYEYQSSIFHPAYLYTIFIPLLALSLLTYFLMSRGRKTTERDTDSSEASADTDTPEQG